MSFVSKKPTITVKVSHDIHRKESKSNNTTQKFNPQSLKIYDEYGNDLTPLPMIIEDKRIQQLEGENVGKFSLIIYFRLVIRHFLHSITCWPSV